MSNLDPEPRLYLPARPPQRPRPRWGCWLPPRWPRPSACTPLAGPTESPVETQRWTQVTQILARHTPRGQILGRKPDKSPKRFLPCYSKSPQQLCLEIYISSNSRNLLQFLKCVSVKEKGGKPDRKPYSLPYGLRNPNRNLKTENSQDYATKPQRNCTFMNSASGLVPCSATWLKGIPTISEIFRLEGLSQHKSQVIYRVGFFIAKIGKYWHALRFFSSKLNQYCYTDKKEEKQIFLIYKEIQKGSVEKSYMTNGLLSPHIWFIIFTLPHIFGSPSSYTWLCNWSHLNVLTYEENFVSFFISVYS